MPFAVVGIAADEDGMGENMTEIVPRSERVKIRPTTLAAFRDVAEKAGMSENEAIATLLELLPSGKQLTVYAMQQRRRRGR